ncbi:NAD(P)-dependent oxidoreductase [Zhihengliuella salsuginis]|uniref:2-hydroxy-3-oxopropionate reductase n=1 Tax=Zhihengliuella salsuginis TaxID=578222 RepID=A0ABQ3GAP9_9MICC|nr:NAD(P)-dependent oxidoreductase [Zhihengliuella salsuginis]GHC98818.1 2-hydroxy-3-oxopropionate reductase [Zhihengliuella salsuginis]
MTRPDHASPLVGVIGLGAMGAPMARHLAAGHGRAAVTARRPRGDVMTERLLGSPAAAIDWHDDAASLARTCDAVLLMVPDLPQVIDLLDGPAGLLAGAADRPQGADPLLVIVGSTCSAPGIQQLGGRLAETAGADVRLVDAPVSGGEDGAMAGTLSIMMGGTEADCGRAARALAPCGTPVRLGPLGAGEVAKSCNQLVVSATILALGEATVLAERSGIDVGQMWDLLGHGYASSRLLDTRKDKLVSRDDSPSGAAKYLLKDLECGLEVAEATATRAALLPALRESFAQIVAAGLGDRDMAVTRRFVAER